MRLPSAIARFLPMDPGYAPFGWQSLRGFDMVPLLLATVVGGSFALQRLFRGLMQEQDNLWNTLWRSTAAIVSLEAALIPMLAFLVLALNRRDGAPRSARRLGFIAAAVVAGAAVFAQVWWPASFCLTGRIPWSDPDCAKSLPIVAEKVGFFILASIWGGLIAAVLWFDRRGREAARALAEARQRRVTIEREETEARLRALQAQIEPHFLFNTLAHVRRFQAVDPQQGRRMLASLIDYMRAALPQMRETRSTLARELALTRAYAEIQRIRMGERLRVEVDVPDALLELPMPPMMLLTLAENAVKHGLGPKRDGGTLRIGARRDGGRVEVAVQDDGVGLRVGSGTGRGLANTRSRLATQFGDAAELTITAGERGGVRAALWLPVPA